MARLVAFVLLIAFGSACAQQNASEELRVFQPSFGVFKPGGSVISTSAAISGTKVLFEHETQEVFRNARIGMDEYRFKVPNGRYRVHLNFAEIEKRGIGERVFGMKLQGMPVVDRLDIFAEVGRNHAYQLISGYVDVTDGVLVLRFIPIVGEPLLSAISVGGEVDGAISPVDGALFAHMNCGGSRFRGFNPDFGVADEIGPSPQVQASASTEGR